MREAVYDAEVPTGVWTTDASIVLKIGGPPGEMRYRLLDDSAYVVMEASFTARPRVPDASCAYCPSAVSRDGAIAMATSDTSYRILRSRLDGIAMAAIERADRAAVRRSDGEADSVAAMWEDIAQRMIARGAPERLITRLRHVSGESSSKRRFLGRGLVFDESGSLWAQLAVRDGDSAAVHVYDRDAASRGGFRLPDGMVMRRVRDGGLIATTIAETGETTVVAYDVTRE